MENVKLAVRNFTVNSYGWKTKEYRRGGLPENIAGVFFRVNPKEDIWELENGEQLFTQEAALREVSKAGKRLPTKEEFKALVNRPNDVSNLVFAGSSCYYARYVIYHGCNYEKMAQFWSSEKGCSFMIQIGGNESSVNGCWSSDSCDPLDGLSVRCIA